jgi:Lrp/AsnC family leucine-responsive transcriptional regulator
VNDAAQRSSPRETKIAKIAHQWHYPWRLSLKIDRPGENDMDFDRYDIRILAELQRDGRLAVVELAEAIGLSPTPCARRIKALESSGAIEGYSAVLNPRRIGLEIMAMVQVKLSEHTDETVARFEKEIALLDEVTNCYALTGTYDFILQVYGKDLDSLSNVVLKRLLRIPNVRDLQSSVVLDTVKRSTRLPLAHLQP